MCKFFSNLSLQYHRIHIPKQHSSRVSLGKCTIFNPTEVSCPASCPPHPTTCHFQMKLAWQMIRKVTVGRLCFSNNSNNENPKE